MVYVVKVALREYVPLKQGLRHAVQFVMWKRRPRLREYVPLKQGLRRLCTICEEEFACLSESMFH